MRVDSKSLFLSVKLFVSSQLFNLWSYLSIPLLTLILKGCIVFPPSPLYLYIVHIIWLNPIKNGGVFFYWLLKTSLAVTVLDFQELIIVFKEKILIA